MNVSALERLLSAESKEALQHLELFARKSVQGWMHGVHPSKRLGVSTEFDHHKNYQAGDPIKHVDWKASARHDRFYVKRYLEDTSLRVRLVVDRSASMLQDQGGTTKYLHAQRTAACLAYLVVNHGDLVGLMLASTVQNHWLPMGSTQGHMSVS